MISARRGALAFDSTGELLDVGDDAAVPLGDVAAKLAGVKLGLVGHGVMSRSRVGVLRVCSIEWPKIPFA